MKITMKKNILSIFTIAALVLFSACSNEEIMTENKPVESPQMLTIEASIPGDDAKTRVSLTEDETTRNIDLTWDETDKIDLAFVQGETIITNKGVQITNISADGKSAKFAINVPSGIDASASFNLYGVHGGRGLLENTTTAKIQTGLKNSTSLKDIKRQNAVMLYFQSEGVDITNPQISVTFKHIGSIISIKFRNAGTNGEIFEDIKKLRLMGTNNQPNNQWVYRNNARFNEATADGSFDLITREINNPVGWDNTKNLGNDITFEYMEKDENGDPIVINLSPGEDITFMGWIPIHEGVEWPTLWLDILNSGVEGQPGTLIGRSKWLDFTTPKTPQAGMHYSVYAEYVGGFSETGQHLLHFTEPF